MKKIAILTSVLALAACGGGGGGGGGAGGTQLPPPLPPVMLEDGNSTTTVARNVNDINYKVYKKLTSNTELISAHHPFSDASTESAKYTKSLELVDEMDETLHGGRGRPSQWCKKLCPSELREGTPGVASLGRNIGRAG